MRIIALYKTFGGEEFVEASLESIYNFVSKIVMVHSHVSWCGDKGNTVLPVVNNWKQKHDTKWNKVINLEGNYTDQNEQYNVGLKYIQANFEYDYIMLIDTDEVWEKASLGEAVNKLVIMRKQRKRYRVITCRLYTYIKDIFYRIEPPEQCSPSVFISPRVKSFTSARCWNEEPRYPLDNIFFHHFSFVRSTEEKIQKKILTSSAGDGSGTEEGQAVVENWLEDKYNKLPNVTDFHYQENFKTWWKGIKEVGIEDLPKTLQNKAIVKQFLKEKE